MEFVTKLLKPLDIIVSVDIAVIFFSNEPKRWAGHY